MKNTKLTLLSTLFAATLYTGAVVHANEKGEAAHDSAMVNMPMAEHTGHASVALAILHAHLDSVNADLAAGKLARIHEHAEAMNAAIKNLAADPSLDETKKKRVQGYVKNIAKFSDSMHDAADEKKTAEAQKWAKKVVAQAELLEKQFTGKNANNVHPK